MMEFDKVIKQYCTNEGIFLLGRLATLQAYNETSRRQLVKCYSLSDICKDGYTWDVQKNKQFMKYVLQKLETQQNIVYAVFNDYESFETQLVCFDKPQPCPSVFFCELKTLLDHFKLDKFPNLKIERSLDESNYVKYIFTITTHGIPSRETVDNYAYLSSVLDNVLKSYNIVQPMCSDTGCKCNTSTAKCVVQGGGNNKKGFVKVMGRWRKLFTIKVEGNKSVPMVNYKLKLVFLPYLRLVER